MIWENACHACGARLVRLRRLARAGRMPDRKDAAAASKEIATRIMPFDFETTWRLVSSLQNPCMPRIRAHGGCVFFRRYAERCRPISVHVATPDTARHLRYGRFWPDPPLPAHAAKMPYRGVCLPRLGRGLCARRYHGVCILHACAAYIAETSCGLWMGPRAGASAGMMPVRYVRAQV